MGQGESIMKQVIEGKTYNTETATCLAEASSNCSTRDYNFWKETLYRTKNGAYFIAGEGGPMSSWSRSTGQNEWSGGSGIRVLTEAEAREWVERYANDEYEEIFGAAEEA
jgi:hypothetical protein